MRRRGNVTLVLSVVLGVSLLALVALLVVYFNLPTRKPGGGRADPGPPRPIKPAVRVDAYRLWQEAGENALAAQSKYGKGPVEITARAGVVREEDGRHYVGIVLFESMAVTPEAYSRKSPQEKKWFREGYPPSVYCYIDPAAEKQFAGLKPGASVRIIGTYKGAKKDPEVPYGYVLILEGCSLAPG